MITMIEFQFWRQYLAVFCAGICFFNRGLHAGWTSPALPKLLTNDTEINKYFQITSDQGSWIVVLYSVSISLGALLASQLVDRIGRKNTILLTALPHLASFILIGLAQRVEYIYTARILAGIGEGLTNIVLPIYVGEISSSTIRGFLGSVIAIYITLGLLVINIVGSYMSQLQTVVICGMFPILLAFSGFWIPETPYYLFLVRNKMKDAESVLQKMYGSNVSTEKELKAMTQMAESQQSENTSLWNLLSISTNRQTIIIALFIETILQFSGISAIQSYTQIIFAQSENSISPEMSSIFLMSVQLFVSLFAINFVDCLGRKPLLILSCFGCSLSLGLEGLYFYLQSIEYADLYIFNWLPLTCLISYVIVYSIGLAIIVNVLLGELFATNFKAKAMGIIVIWYGILAFIVSKLFYLVSVWTGMYVSFWFFAICCLLGVVYIYYFVPETKGKTLREIQEWFENKKDTASNTHL